MRNETGDLTQNTGDVTIVSDDTCLDIKMAKGGQCTRMLFS